MKRITFKERVIEICRQKNYELYEASVERADQDTIWEVIVREGGSPRAFGFSIDKDSAYSHVYGEIGGLPIRKERRIV